MTDTFQETVVKAVLAELGNITEAAGYYNTLARVQRHDSRTPTIQSPKGDILADKPCVVLRTVGPARELRGGAYNQDATMEIHILGMIRPLTDADGDLTSDEAVSRLEDDIYNALAKALDPQTGVAGATMRRCTAKPISDEDPKDPEDGIIITATIEFAHDFRNTRLAIS